MNRNMIYMVKRIISSIATTLVYISIDQMEDKYTHHYREKTRKQNQKSYKQIYKNYEAEQENHTNYMRESFSKGKFK